MFNFFKSFVGRCADSGEITNLTMNETYGSINVIVRGEKYLVTIMKEEKKDDSV